MLIIKVTKEFEPVIDIFITSNNDIDVEKSRVKSFDGSTEIIALIIATIASPAVLNKIIDLIDTLIEQYVEVQKENHRYEEAKIREANRHEEEKIREVNRHKEEKIRETNRHKEELNKQNMNQITVIQKKDDYDVSVLLKLPASNDDVAKLREKCLEQLELTNKMEE